MNIEHLPEHLEIEGDRLEEVRDSQQETWTEFCIFPIQHKDEVKQILRHTNLLRLWETDHVRTANWDSLKIILSLFHRHAPHILKDIQVHAYTHPEGKIDHDSYKAQSPNNKVLSYGEIKALATGTRRTEERNDRGDQGPQGAG